MTRECTKCRGFLGVPRQDDADPDDTDACCTICLGLWTSDASLEHAIDEACVPYGGMEANRFSVQHPPTVVVPGDVALRYHLSALEETGNAAPLSVFLHDLKAHLKAVALKHVRSRQVEALTEYPACVESEEQGCLCVHVQVTPVSEVSRPSSFVLPDKKRQRKRFRGHDPTEKQGGDPRQNLDRRLINDGKELWSCADVQAVLEQEEPIQPSTLEAWREWFGESKRCPRLSVEYHVAVWRLPFFLRGLYTKSRRDASQTPFYVPSEENASSMKRLGVTSVEEQINSVLTKTCGGISTLNNDPSGDDIVYSMIKFHASGREDLDVRMLLPPEPVENVGGRPFICQVIDSLCMPTMDQVKQVPCLLNRSSLKSSDTNEDLVGRQYGRNQLGVDISDDFSFVPSVAFKNLQGETEEKVKYYGCLCWNKEEITSQDDLERRLCPVLPLQLKQKTPIRVLHRRTNAIRVRHVLTLKPNFIDKHHFRLNLSTDGDLGRTVPSVSSLLGCKTDILELDCECIAGV